MAHLKAHPDDAAAWTSLGRMFLANGQVEDALQAQRKVIGLKPDNAQAYADLADILAIANGRSLEGASEKALLKALELDADNVKALALSGTLALSRGQAEKAAQFWERALRNSAANAPLSAQLERAIALARSRAP
jgi:cytochrome c-type biogenesis protein CcmH